jgi:hypothetical protein
MVDEENRVVYVPIRPICVTLGIDSRTQVDRIQKDEQYAGAREEILVPTSGGRQEMVCLRAREAAWWVFSISPQRLPAHLRENLTLMKQGLMDAADRLLFGDLSAVVRAGEFQIGRPMRGELTFSCPRCGSPLCFVIEDTDIHLRVDKS